MRSSEDTNASSRPYPIGSSHANVGEPERLPSGELAWLRPEPRYVLTDKGRAEIAS